MYYRPIYVYYTYIIYVSFIRGNLFLFQAESYYRHAAQLVPSNGQPYNQLAILAAAGGDILSTAFYYCRSLAVKYPFPGSGTNLKRQLSKIIDGYV